MMPFEIGAELALLLLLLPPPPLTLPVPCAVPAVSACLQIEWARLTQEELFAEGATWERVLHTKQSEAGEYVYCWYC